MGDISEHLKREEIQCRCGCKSIVRINTMIDLFEAIREEYGHPIMVNSWYRCIRHNKHVGGTFGSLHMTGRAMDIRPHANDLKELYKACEKFAPPGLGTYPEKGFIHVDIGNRYQRWVMRNGKHVFLFG